MNHASRPALTQRSRTSTTVRVAITALLAGLFAVVGFAPAQAAGGGTYTSLTSDSNGSVAITGYGLDGQRITRTLTPGGRTNAEGFDRVTTWQIGARTSVTVYCFRWNGASWYQSAEPRTETNRSYSNGNIYGACVGSDRMDIKVRVYP